MTLLHHPRPNEPQLQAGIPPHDCWTHRVLMTEHTWGLFTGCRNWEWLACSKCGMKLSQKVQVR